MNERMILHVDGDGFFAGCEVSKDRRLRGKPVVVGKDRGIALAMTYEAKALGIKRGMKIHEIRRLFPSAVIVPTDFGAYSIFSERMTNIVSRYSTKVEHYSIDECFADVNAQCTPTILSPLEFAQQIKHDLETELGMTFSVGVAPTKVLAKIASSHNKPSGCTILYKDDINRFLANIPVAEIWGVGHRTAPRLIRLGLFTALMVKEAPLHFISSHFSLPLQEIWHELHGTSALLLHTKEEPPKSLARTRTFTPHKDRAFVLAQLSNNIELALMKLRHHNLVAAGARFFLKTQTFHYDSRTISFNDPLDTPQEALKVILPQAESLFRTHTLYRASGVTFFGLTKKDQPQQTLFVHESASAKERSIYNMIDKIEEKYGERSIFLLQSKPALDRQEHTPKASLSSLLRIPHLGEIS